MRRAAERAIVVALSEDQPETPGLWFQFVVTEAADGAHIGHVAAHVDSWDPRLARVGI